MALRLGALHDALLDTGAHPDKTARAAEELADYERQRAAIRADLAVLKWMVGTLIVLQIALGFGNVLVSFNILSRLP